jgi:hypothetical protein
MTVRAEEGVVTQIKAQSRYRDRPAAVLQRMNLQASQYQFPNTPRSLVAILLYVTGSNQPGFEVKREEER